MSLEKKVSGVLAGAFLGFCSVSRADLTLAWDPSPSPYVNKYIVYAKEIGGGTFKYGAATNQQPDGSVMKRISGLKHNHAYKFYVTAKNGFDMESDPCESIIVVNLNSPVEGRSNFSSYISNVNDVNGPTLNVTNASAISDFNSNLRNYSLGSIQNPIYSKSGYIDISGDIRDESFVKNFEANGDINRVISKSYDVDGGRFELRANLSKTGTNILNLISEDFVGNSSTNTIYAINSFGDKDSDSDGINDLDEFFVYNTDKYKKDSDSDGINDLDEIIRGYDPLNAEDRFNPVVVNKSPFTINYYAVPGNYYLLASTNLSDFYDSRLKISIDRWEPIQQTNIQDKGVYSFIDNEHHNFDKRFYRILPEVDFSTWHYNKMNKMHWAEEELYYNNEMNGYIQEYDEENYP